jgi:lytic cellulose monooxygenase (C1-hydroxylating)
MCVSNMCVKKQAPTARYAKKRARCGGRGYSGPTQCEHGSYCKRWGPNFSQCLPARKPSGEGGGGNPGKQGGQRLYGQCFGEGWKGPHNCARGGKCVVVNKWYSQCKPSN